MDRGFRFKGTGANFGNCLVQEVKAEIFALLFAEIEYYIRDLALRKLAFIYIFRSTALQVQAVELHDALFTLHQARRRCSTLR